MLTVLGGVGLGLLATFALGGEEILTARCWHVTEDYRKEDLFSSFQKESIYLGLFLSWEIGFHLGIIHMVKEDIG